MANQRPINRRPWRRKPWRGTRRSARWCELNTNYMTEPCTYTAFNAVCVAEDPNLLKLGVAHLWDGDADAEYADGSTVVVDRIVGDITIRGLSTATSDQVVVPQFRMGLLAVEEVDNIADWTPPNLWVREDVEEFQWMWLYHTGFGRAGWTPTAPFEPYSGFRYGDELHVDLRVKRKLGKKDHLVMLAQFAALGGLVGNVSVSWTHCLRGIFTSK